MLNTFMRRCVVIKVRILKSFEAKVKGLVGTKKIYPVYFTTREVIHTFGMLSPIDVLILSKNKKVVSLKKSLKPNRFFFWNPIYNGVLELPSGTIEKRGIKIGDNINLTIST